MFSQELRDYEMSQLIQQGKITNIGEAIRKLNKEYFKIWMKMYYPNINPESLDACYGYIFLAFWCGVDYANESHEKRDKEKETLSFFNKLK